MNNETAPLHTRFPAADRGARGRWGLTAVAVVDTLTGEFYANELARYPIRAASIIKVAILLAFLDRAKSGDPGALTPAERADAEAMIRRSDNAATTRFWKRLGGETVIEFIGRSAGTRDTVLSPENRDWWGYTRTTAADMARLLAKVAGHAVVSPSACDYVMAEMRQVAPAQRWGIPEGAPVPALVAVKNGWYPENDAEVWRVHSLGIAPVGGVPSRAAIAILTRYPIAYTMRYGEEGCQAVARAILHEF
jgi:beta-lactamase class A